MDMDNDTIIRVATIVPDTEAEGPGRRWAIWLQGCSIRCPGCCNPEMFDARRGTQMSINALDTQLSAAAASGVVGITILGGEPFEQSIAAADLATAARSHGLTVMVFSGYYLAEIRARVDSERLLEMTDILVDGRYDRERPEPTPPIGRRWIGSTNQTMHYLTDAYSAADPQMRTENTIEVRLVDGRLLINGWPSADNIVRLREVRGRLGE